jgi:uncharacterized membrane protein
MSQELITFFTASLPISELRGAIPLAIGVFHFSIYKAFIISVLGNFIFIIPFLFFLQKFSEYLMHRWFLFNRLMTWLFERTRRKHMDHFHAQKWTNLALFLFVAIPLPMTGAWSGTVAAYILGVSFWRAILFISLGILTAGVIVTIITTTGFSIIQSFS